ncbi:MAG: hypothetical protein BWY09_00193 [Candidatus Hydrogenedentes bacterium ADurb.Bin179]|jgi:hypothetical protein|nr:MAG: hypothetical protein BWY09_00193 [Candidatus Hydrogenedentes bacterium ADurb.Bin179]
MNTKILIGFFVLLAIFLLLPVVAQIIRSTGGGGGELGGPPPPGPKAEPLLNASNLVGTAWNVKTPEMPIAVTVTLNSGGQAVATVPALFAPIARQQLGTDTLTGNWSVQGNKLIASVTFQGKGFQVECDIIGDKIYYNNKEIPRVQ